MAGYGSFELALATLEGWLGTHDFAAGSRFTMADTYLGSQVIWGLQFGSIPESKVLRSYSKRLTSREAYIEARAVDQRLIEEGEKS